MNEKAAQSAIRKFEWVVNVVLGLVVVLFIGVIAQRFLSSSKPKGVRSLEVGKKLNLPGVDLAAGKQTLLLALSTDCRFCTESAALYRRLTSELAHNSETRVVAVLPQSVKEGRQYLERLGVPVDTVLQVNLASAGFAATPTLAIVKNDGTITDMWTGTLKVADRFTLFNRLHIKNEGLATDDSGPTSIDALTLKHTLDKKAPVLVVDVEDRDFYRWRHIPGAVNIPVDELEARAGDELSPTGSIVVYCREEGLSARAADILMENGFQRVSILKGGLAEWEKAGPQPARLSK